MSGLGLVALAVLKLTLRLDLGPEWDSNANRAEIVQGAQVTDVPTASFLVRTTGRGTLVWRKGANVLRASTLLGGKIFFNAAVQDQNMFVAQAGVEDRVRVRQWLEMGVLGEYYDATQQSSEFGGGCSVVSCDRHRDFRSGGAVARVGFLDDPGSLVLMGGYRGFQWKPDPLFDFDAAQATVLAGVRLYAGPPDREHEIDLTASYHLENRVYNGLLEINTCTPGMALTSSCIQFGGDKRADFFHEGTIELTWLRVVLVSAAYSLQVNTSNSFGQSLLRHIVTAKLATRLPWELYVTLKGQLLVTRYLDPVLLDRQVNSQTFISIEDENRNAVVADIERPLGRSGLAINARYSFYTNELTAAPVTFLRHVVYVGLSYSAATR